jgi:hypothetical protein
MLRWIAGAAALGIAVFLGANLVDQALTPEAAALLQPPRRELADEDNAWFMLVGLAAREDPVAFAKEWTAAAVQVRTQEALDEFEQRFAPRLLPIPSDAILKRYPQLYDYKGLEEPELASIYSPLPYGAAYGYTWAKEQLQHKALTESDFRSALKALWQDTDLQRRMLAGSSYFVSKAVFTVALARNYLALSALLEANRAKVAAESGALGELLSPLTAEELGVARAAASEARFLVALARGEGLLARPNATANSAAVAARAALEFRDAATYRAQIGSLARGWRDLYNPVGKRIAQSGWADLAEILARLQDLELLRGLVAYQAGVAKEAPDGVKVQGDEAYIEPKSERFRALGRDGRIRARTG